MITPNKQISLFTRSLRFVVIPKVFLGLVLFKSLFSYRKCKLFFAFLTVFKMQENYK